MKVTLPRGVTIEGTFEQVISAAKALGYSLPTVEKGSEKFYYSSSKGEFIEISTMNLVHIKNAFLKLYREWTEELSKEEDFEKLLYKLTSGPDEPVVKGLFRELAKKVKESKT